MGAPTTLTATSGVPDVAPTDVGSPLAAVDPLADIGSVLTALKERDARSAQSAAELLEDRQEFFDAFRELCKTTIRPAMEAVLDRMRREGGDGLIEEHPGGEPRVSTPRLALWMSLQGPIDGTPRLDRNPYLQLDADVTHRVIRLTEGDIWQGAEAGHSGSAGTWDLAQVTWDLVAEELIDIVRRSARIPSS
jgi:hypothetical protein